MYGLALCGVRKATEEQRTREAAAPSSGEVEPHTMVPMLSPMPLYWYTMLASSLEAAATEMRSLLRSS
ncbi:hypothetical protein EYF80_046370 [Liparis tanakae]|uniref:Uncharacterized protein n=1 Tax=Liparis tanakae TaxID=230148 RepID=A0A4Z2FR36_9TELE|nr:hypothetical protein EYF80_046370 [Liparis tanakae]